MSYKVNLKSLYYIHTGGLGWKEFDKAVREYVKKIEDEKYKDS